MLTQRLSLIFIIVSLAACNPSVGSPAPDHTTEQSTGIVVFHTEAERAASVQSATRGSGEDAYKLYIDFVEAGKPKEAQDWLTLAAARKWPQAERDLGLMWLSSSSESVREEGRAMVRKYIQSDASRVPEREYLERLIAEAG